jgi:hypothetical protein
MGNFIVGVIFGIIVSTIGFAGLASYLDKGVVVVKEAVTKASE